MTSIVLSTVSSQVDAKIRANRDKTMLKSLFKGIDKDR